MKKQLMSIISYVLSFVFFCNFNLPYLVHAAQEEEGCFGFKLIKKYEYQEHPVLVFEHEKTGATVLIEKNDDIDKSFSVALRTPAEDDKGTNHVLEHCIAMSGSGAVKTNQLLYDLERLAYCTSINAATYHCYTKYFVSSYDEDELNTLADFYVDAVFNSNFFEDERLFKREGIRFELDEHQKLKPNGRAFNEINRPGFATKEELECLYQGTKMQFVAGGHPLSMINLTIQDLYDTYKKYYHPSNSLFILSGDINYERTFKWLDQKYLSKFERKDMSYVEFKTEKYSEPKNFISSKVFTDASTKNKNTVSCYYKVDVRSLDFKKKFKKLAEIISDNSTEVHKYLKSLGYTNFVVVPVNMPFVSYVCLTLNADNADLLEEPFIRSTLKEAFKRVSIDQQILESQNSRDDFYEHIDKCSNKAYKSLPYRCVFNSFVETMNPISSKYFEVSGNKILDTDDINFSADEFNKFVSETFGTIEPIISVKKVSHDPEDSSETKLKKKLELMEKDKEILTKGYLEQREWGSIPTSEEALTQIKSKLKKASEINTPNLSQEVDKYDIFGKPCYIAKSNVDDLLDFSLFFNVNHLEKEDLVYLKIFNLLINNVGIGDSPYELTKRQKEDKLKLQIGLPSLSIKSDKTQQAIYRLTFTTTKEKLKDANNIFKQILLFPNFKEYEIILSIIKERIDILEGYGTKIQKLIDECGKFGDERDSYQSQVTTSEFLEYLKKVFEEINTSKNTRNLEKKLIETRDKVLNKNTFLSSAIVASSENVEVSEEVIKDILSSLPNMDIELKSLNIKKGGFGNFILNMDGALCNSIIQTITFEDYKCEDDLKIFSKILSDYYLNPNVMNSLGAYSMMCFASLNTINYLSMLNPNIKETLKIFEGLLEFSETFEISKEDLDFICKNFISSNLSILNKKLAIARSQINSIVEDKEETFCSKCNSNMNSIKNFKPERIKELFKILKDAYLNKHYSTFVITPEKSLSLDGFDMIECEQNTVDSSVKTEEQH